MTDHDHLARLEEEHRRLQEARSRGGRARAARWEAARREALDLLRAGKLTAREIARRVGVTSRTLRNWEHAEHFPNLDSYPSIRINHGGTG